MNGRGAGAFFALIELMGFARAVGFCSWQPGGMLRVDLLGEDGFIHDEQPSIHYGPGALFGVYPVSREIAEETARLTIYPRFARPLPAWAVHPISRDAVVALIPAPQSSLSGDTQNVADSSLTTGTSRVSVSDTDDDIPF